MSKSASTEIATQIPEFDEDQLRSISSIEDAIALFETTMGATVVTADESLGDGFAIVDKAELVGKAMVLLKWNQHMGDFGYFTSVYAVVQHPGGVVQRAIFNDGSTGINKQLNDYSTKTGKWGGLIVRKGLRVSRYEFTGPDGTTKPAETYYLDTSA